MRVIDGKKVYTRQELKKLYGVDVSDVHQDSILTNISIKYQNAQYVAEQILPVVPVKKDSDKYYVYTKKDSFSIPETLRAPRTEPHMIDWSTSTASYSANEYALATLIDDSEKENADKPIDVEIDSTELLTDLLRLDQEKRVADMVFSTTYITNYTDISASSVQWNDYPTSNPIDDVESAKQSIHEDTGKFANVVLMGKQVWDKLKHHPDILDRIKYTAKGVITTDLVADIFEVDRVLVGSALYNSANEGQTISLGYIWGKHVLVAYVETRPGLKKASLGYILRSRNFQVRKARNEMARSDWIGVDMKQDEKLVAADCGYLLTNAVA